MAYEDWGLLLSERFPSRDFPTTQAAWDAMKQGLAVGHSVTGEVVSKAHFGAWLDIDVGFPALLLIPDVAGLTPERYQEDEWCPIGSALTADVVLFNDRDHVVRVSQRVPHERRDETPVTTPDRLRESH